MFLKTYYVPAQTMNRTRRKMLMPVVLWGALCTLPARPMAQADRSAEVNQIEAELDGLVTHATSPDDPLVAASIREAIAAVREGSGGIGACLVREATGEIVERGHNRCARSSTDGGSEPGADRHLALSRNGDGGAQDGSYVSALCDRRCRRASGRRDEDRHRHGHTFGHTTAEKQTA
jgi:hypothetical protein